MRVRYHVIVVMPSSSAILIDRQESMWLLPCMADENTVRGADVVRRGLAAIGVSGRIRWMEAIAFQADAAELEPVHELLQIDGPLRVFGRVHFQMARRVHREVAVAPA